MAADQDVDHWFIRIPSGALLKIVNPSETYFLCLAVFGHTFLVFWPGTCPNRSEMAAGFTGSDFQPEPSILDPFRSIFEVLARPENQGWAKTWLVAHLKIRARPKLGLGPPTRPADSGSFFWAPFRNFFLHVFRRHFLLNLLEISKNRRVGGVDIIWGIS